MKHHRHRAAIVAAYFICLAMTIHQTAAQTQDKPKADTVGRIRFDFPDAPEARVEINLSGRLISLVAKGAKHKPEFAELVGMLKGVYVRVYENDAADFDRQTQHYMDRLKKENWEVLAKVKEKEETVHVRILMDEDTVYGIFVIVSSLDETVLVNIVGEIAPERVADLINEFDALGLPDLEDLEIETDGTSKKKEQKRK